MISDNATCFEKEEIKLDAGLVTVSQQVQWKFIIEAAPWCGRILEETESDVSGDGEFTRNFQRWLLTFNGSFGVEDVEEVLTPLHQRWSSCGTIRLEYQKSARSICGGFYYKAIKTKSLETRKDYMYSIQGGENLFALH